MDRKKVIILALIVLASGIGFWFYKESTKPRPGEEVADLGREHTEDIYGIVYNSNPPTSGMHFPIWAKEGLYDRVLSDGYLIHSLEHGYVIISYNCEKGSDLSLISSVLAHDAPLVTSTNSGIPLMHMTVQPQGAMSWFTPEKPPEIAVELPESFQTEDCSKLVEELKPFLNEAQRIIIVPRPSMDTKISLTAWTRILKLDNVDKGQMKKFIEAYHNRGPERTVE